MDRQRKALVVYIVEIFNPAIRINIQGDRTKCLPMFIGVDCILRIQKIHGSSSVVLVSFFNSLSRMQGPPKQYLKKRSFGASKPYNKTKMNIRFEKVSL